MIFIDKYACSINNRIDTMSYRGETHGTYISRRMIDSSSKIGRTQMQIHSSLLLPHNRSVMKAKAPLTLLLLTTLQYDVNALHSCNAFLVPRGGGQQGGGESSRGESSERSSTTASNSANTSSSTRSLMLRQEMEESIKWIEPQLQNLITSIQQKHQISKRCQEMDQQTTLTLKDMDMDLFKLSIHTMILPPGLQQLPALLLGGGMPLSYQYLHDQVASLRVDAVTMHSKLRQYIAILNESLELQQNLVDAMQQVKRDLLLLLSKHNNNHHHNDEEAKQRSSPFSFLPWKHWSWKQQTEKDVLLLQKDAHELKELALSASTRIEELERQANDHVRNDFLETATVVQQKAQAMDQLVKGNLHMMTMSNNGNNPSDDDRRHSHDPAPLSVVVMEEPIEIQVEMTTFHYSNE